MIDFDNSNPGPRRDPGSSVRPQRRTAQLVRDAALRRVAVTRTGVIVSSAGLTAGFVVLVADTAPGKTYKTSSRSSAPSKTAAQAAARHRGTRSLAAALPPLATPSQLGLAAASAGSGGTSTGAAPTGAASTGAASTGAASTGAASATSPAQAATSATSAATATQPAGTATGSAPVAPVQQAPVVSGGS
jgi:hypothetical protein